MEAITIPNLLREHIPWSRETFGKGQRTGGITKHIEQELVEIRDAPNDLEEWCDVIILALDGAWRSGHTPEQIEVQLASKMERNRKREWPKPKSQDEPVNHIKRPRPESDK